MFSKTIIRGSEFFCREHYEEGWCLFSLPNSSLVSSSDSLLLDLAKVHQSSFFGIMGYLGTSWFLVERCPILCKAMSNEFWRVLVKASPKLSFITLSRNFGVNQRRLVLEWVLLPKELDINGNSTLCYQMISLEFCTNYKWWIGEMRNNY